MDDAAWGLEFEGRIGRLQALMHRLDLDGLLICGNGSPDGVASVRWLTGARAWAGVMLAVLIRDERHPYVISHSSYQALWSRKGAATRPDRVEWAAKPVLRAVELLAAARRFSQIGLVGPAKMFVTDMVELQASLRGQQLVDVTQAFDALRRHKSALEIEEFRLNGARLSGALQLFAERVKPGVSLIEVSLAAEAEARRDGGFWSRAKVAVGATPYTIPPESGELFPADEVVTCELVTESPRGYWTEMTVHVTCGAVPDATVRLFDAYWAASEAAMATARPGVRQEEIGLAGDAVLTACGFPPVARHTPDCHSIGLDGADGPSSLADPDFALHDGMVLSMHPGAITAGSRGFLVSDNVLVTPNGGCRLSPHGHERRWIVKPA